jgi:tricorn protease
VAALLAASFPNTAESTSARFFHSPTLHEDSIAFIHGSEVWLVGTEGGDARQLTADSLPKRNVEFSRDGKWLAYSADANGDLDIYTIELDLVDARPARRTWHPDDDEVRGWNSKGEILFTSGRHHWDGLYADLYTLALDAGLPTRLRIGKAAAADFSPGDDYVVFAPIQDSSDIWKRYRGGMTSPLWIVDRNDYSHVEIPHERATETEPVWVDDTIYFRSDRTGVRSIHAYDRTSGRVSKVETGLDTPIDAFDADERMLAFASEGYLYRLDFVTGNAQRLDIDIKDAEKDTRPAKQDVSNEIEVASVSPDGRSVVFEARGDIFLLRPGQSTPINLTDSPGAGDRDPAWAPDGRRIVFLSDKSGEYAYHVLNTSDSETASRRIDLPRKGYGFGAIFSRDGRRLAYIDHTGRPWWCEIEEGVFRPIDVQSGLFPTPVWSADGEAIYLPRFESRTGYAQIVEIGLGSGEVRQLTDELANVASLSLSADGSKLFFLASVNAGPTATSYDFSAALYEGIASWAVYSLALEEPPQGGARIVRHEAKPRPYSALHTLSDGRVLLEAGRPYAIWSSMDEADGSSRRLYVFDPHTSKEFEIEKDIRSYDVAMAAPSLLAFVPNNELQVITLGAGAEADSTVIPVDQLLVRDDPAAEYLQMFEETWRSARDFFYDPDLHGVDWDAMRDRYRRWMRDVQHREDLDFVLKKLLSELVNSHISVEPPRIGPDHNSGEKSGLLGANLVLDENGYRVEEVLRVPFWSEVRSPLPGAVEGRYLSAVNGVKTSRSLPLYKMLVSAGDKVELTFVSADADIVPLVLEVDLLTDEEETELRYREWVEQNRKYVDKVSNGQIAYLHQPDTSRGGLREFIRYFFPQTDRAGIIIDERFNNGGADPDYQLDVLGRTEFQLYAPRDLPFFPSPNSVIDGPKLMLVNAEARSGGDLYPYHFKQRGLGTVIGTRTWGGVNGGFRGSWPRELIDGGRVAIPDLGTYSVDGKYIIENIGLIPDIEVEIYPSDYASGRDPQLERAVEFLLDQIGRGKMGARFPEQVERVDRSL